MQTPTLQSLARSFVPQFLRLAREQGYEVSLPQDSVEIEVEFSRRLPVKVRESHSVALQTALQAMPLPSAVAVAAQAAQLAVDPKEDRALLKEVRPSKPSTDGRATELKQRLGDRVPKEVEFWVHSHPRAKYSDAFVNGGDLFLSKELLTRYPVTAQVWVAGHELAHLSQRHQIAQIGVVLLQDLARVESDGFLEELEQEFQSLRTRQEDEADLKGLALAREMGFSQSEVVEGAEKFLKEVTPPRHLSQTKGGHRRPEERLALMTGKEPEDFRDSWWQLLGF